MKINWGTGIVIAIVLFMTFILSYVYKVQSNSRYDHEMVTEDYYKIEKNINNEYEKKSNASNLQTPLQFFETKQGLIITFPSNFNYKDIKGNISLYRPSNEKLDFEHPIELNSHNLLIPKTKLIDGLWEIKIIWEYQNQQYINQKSFQLE